MDKIFTNLRKHFPSLPQNALKKIYKARSERLRLPMMYNIPADIRGLIEAKVHLAALISNQKKNSESALMASPSDKRFTNICVFGGTNYGKHREFVEAATHLGKVLAERKIHLVYGGGNLGLTGCVLQVARDGGSQVLDIVLKPIVAGDIIGKTNDEG
ncbi:hypothetical protein Ddye_000497 [Dipteronia dyeriana]|uniref:Uncharacterized protein n=1 Tax=Dipteronia dyeriana TaxID=168575 RepID=A0AAD9XME1_9ROSI|nr:hypothetical protein Ddye_000497 [Dipteronia dyeriana]